MAVKLGLGRVTAARTKLGFNTDERKVGQLTMPSIIFERITWQTVPDKIAACIVRRDKRHAFQRHLPPPPAAAPSNRQWMSVRAMKEARGKRDRRKLCLIGLGAMHISKNSPRFVAKLIAKVEITRA
ncbi:RING/U-box superfamily protein [Striga asiatica]|uniref:RING/U-box superfamily protein n=1 Tax=Striga asiatica TaxID=4170 RepID=A0A5A7NVX9_STRAF|nr:RING/U-box superfamily protein [Striga asiatica]